MNSLIILLTIIFKHYLPASTGKHIQIFLILKVVVVVVPFFLGLSARRLLKLFCFEGVLENFGWKLRLVSVQIVEFNAILIFLIPILLLRSLVRCCSVWNCLDFFILDICYFMLITHKPCLVVLVVVVFVIKAHLLFIFLRKTGLRNLLKHWFELLDLIYLWSIDVFLTVVLTKH